MTPAELSRTVLCTVRRAVEAEELRVVVPERVVVEQPRGPRHGDYATNVALRLAKPAGRQPRQVAEILARRLAECPGIARVDIAGSGFLNITLRATAHARMVRDVIAQGARYGRNDSLAGLRVRLACTPAGPRADVVAEAVGALMRACGAHTDDGTAEVVRVQPVREDPLPRLGRDACRWALLRTPPEEVPRLGPAAEAELLVQRESNPLFRVRYSYARARALLRNAHDLGIEGAGRAQEGQDSQDNQDGHDGGAYRHPAETELLGAIADFPRIVEAAARHRGPDRVARHLERTADAFLRMHDAGSVLPRGDEKPSAAHRVRLSLAEAAGVVLAGGLSLLGISAPERL